MKVFENIFSSRDVIKNNRWSVLREPGFDAQVTAYSVFRPRRLRTPQRHARGAEQSGAGVEDNHVII